MKVVRPVVPAGAQVAGAANTGGTARDRGANMRRHARILRPFEKVIIFSGLDKS